MTLDSGRPGDSNGLDLLFPYLEQLATFCGVEPEPKQLHSFSRYLALLERWNRAYNLTAIQGRERRLTHHIYDSLSPLPWLHGERVVDLGSGAGLPGIPLAVMRPEIEMVMVDSSQKRCNFIQQAIVELGLRNASVVHSRAEGYLPERRFDELVSRAFSSLEALLRYAEPLLLPGGAVVAMKGRRSENWDQPLLAGFSLQQVVAVQVPGVEAERHLVICRKGAVRE